MLSIRDINLGFKDAENYKQREYKNLLNKIFVRTDELDKLCQSNIQFLIGEKGTGKTAYAVYLMNNDYKNNICLLKYIRETDYLKFVTMKREKHLILSDYANIWKVIIYLLLSTKLRERAFNYLIFKKGCRFKELQNAIDEYYQKAFSPEIINALQFIEKSEIVAELMAKHIKLKGELGENITFAETKFQLNLFFIQKRFEESFNLIRLDKNYILFIDGIDIRPSTIEYQDYLECIKGLANAVWSVNTDFFSQIKDSPGRLRVVLLIRPDIFESLGLQNPNTKIRDNSIILDWRTTYQNHRNSKIFRVTDHLLSYQQTKKLALGEAWDYYFPFNTPKVKQTFQIPTSFIGFLRLSLYRPRDIITMLDFLKELYIQEGKDENRVFSFDDADSPEFRRRFAEYLLGEIKDQLSFYYTQSDYKIFLKFFEYLNGKTGFNYHYYLNSFNKYDKYLESIKGQRPNFLKSANEFLQFLYDLNVICFIERSFDKKQFFRWCFRERTYSNPSPKIKEGQIYLIHYGVSRALKLGKKIRSY